MIIDFHVHPIERKNFEESLPFFIKNNIKNDASWFDSVGLGANPLLDEMNKAGVDKAVILAVDYNVPELPLVLISNERITEIVKQNTDRFVGFGSVCPTEIINNKNDVTNEKIEACVKEIARFPSIGLKGLKLLPPFQHFYPNDPKVFPIYEECEKLGLPVLIHTGGEVPPGLTKYCNPVYLDDVAKRFPGLNIVAAHMGSYPYGVWFEEMMMVASENKNIFVDLAALRPRELIDLKLLEKAVKYIGSEKILFGSDHPVVLNYQMSKAVETIKNADIIETDKINILGLNAKRILKI